MSAIEDALVARDFRAAKAWGVALAVAILVTYAAGRAIPIDFAASVYAVGPLDLVGTLVGGCIFGFGMALAGTCSFGLLVRVGGGDLRAAITACIVGISAFAFTAGVLAPVRTALSGVAAFDLSAHGGTLLPGLIASLSGLDAGTAAFASVFGIAALLVLGAILDRRMRTRPRLLAAAVVMGIAVGGGWGVTAVAVDRLDSARLESLSFVAPAGRLLLQLMSDTLRDVGFGVSSVVGVVCGAAAAATAKDDIRWEAFDDVREMRRHLTGAMLMGLGGVLARGCTIGQGMSAASALTVSAPLVIVGIVIGARIGLSLLLEGHAMWRTGTGERR